MTLDLKKRRNGGGYDERKPTKERARKREEARELHAAACVALRCLERTRGEGTFETCFRPPTSSPAGGDITREAESFLANSDWLHGCQHTLAHTNVPTSSRVSTRGLPQDSECQGTAIATERARVAAGGVSFLAGRHKSRPPTRAREGRVSAKKFCEDRRQPTTTLVYSY
jgi:hypothetical protein